MSGPYEFRFDVAAALPPEATERAEVALAGWLFLPDDRSLLGERPVAMTLLAGGSYDKRYHHAVVPGRDGYSAAEHLAAQGNVVLLLDHLGVGESTRLPDQKKATRFVVADAADAAVRQFLERLRSGTLLPDLPALPGAVSIGGGHSMGAMLTVIQQARHRTHAGIMVIGYTAEGVMFTMGGKRLRAADFLPTGDAPDYNRNDRAVMREGFHWEDVPDDVVDYDTSIAAETPSSIGFDSIRTRIMVDEAAAIDVPVYICLGERDVSPDHHAEPAYYRASPDITLHLLPRSGHCQSFASGRAAMWDRMDHWAAGIALQSRRAG